jgi:hypothetical protein
MSGAKYEPLGENDPKRHEDNRAVWERPALRRLAANKAERGTTIGDDGAAGTPGNPGRHS